MELFWAVVLVIIIVFITLYNSWNRSKIFHNYLQGLWIGDKKFCEESEIGGLILYIGECDSWHTHNAYLIMYSDESIILEKKIAINTSFSGIHILTMSGEFTQNITVTDLEVNPKDEDINPVDIDDISEINISQVMPESMVLVLNIEDGSMIWKADDKIYAKLYRDNAASQNTL